MKATLVLTGAQLAPLVFCVVLRVSEYAERRKDHAVCPMLDMSVFDSCSGLS